MKLFIDTSALIKAFHNEQGSAAVVKLLSAPETEVYISELTIIEFKSAIYRRVNNGQISEQDAVIAFEAFEEYRIHVLLVPLGSLIIAEADRLFSQYYKYGLRTLDALQFACLSILENSEIIFVTADEKLCKIIEMAGYKAINPIYV